MMLPAGSPFIKESSRAEQFPIDVVSSPIKHIVKGTGTRRDRVKKGGGSVRDKGERRAAHQEPVLLAG